MEPVLLTGASLSENVARMDAQLDAMVPGSLVLEQFKLVGQGARRHGSALPQPHLPPSAVRSALRGRLICCSIGCDVCLCLDWWEHT